MIDGHSLIGQKQMKTRDKKVKYKRGTGGVDIVGQKFGKLTVIKNGSPKCTVQCECGRIKEVWKKTLLEGNVKSCGSNECKIKAYKDIAGQKFGEWTAIKFIGNSMWLCRCSCGKEKIIQRNQLEDGRTLSCGCKFRTNRNNTMMERYGDIGSKRVNNPREKWQIEVLNNKEKFREYLSNFDNKPSVIDVARRLNSSEQVVGQRISLYGLRDYIDYSSCISQSELELRSFIESIYNGKIEYNTRSVIPPQEIDIYIPELKTGIEFNGNYWHSEINKERSYHQEKTIKAAKAGVRLIHIFEYEWINNNRAIKTFIKQLFDKNKQIIYARNTQVIDIDKYTEKEFENKYHLQGYSKSNTAIGLTYNNELIGIMTFGKSRFNEESTEVIRLCYKDTVAVVGGTEKLISAYINKTNDTNIISYCDISKFTGNSYSRVGFKVDRITEPNYVWTNSNSEVLTRYQTQKNKLVSKGLGVESETEADIMYRLGYYRVYNSGNIKLMYNKK